MMKIKKLTLILALAVNCSFYSPAQLYNGMWVGTSENHGAFPAENASRMAKIADANVHTGIVNVDHRDKIMFADYGDGTTQPERIGPAGYLDFPHNENWEYTIESNDRIYNAGDPVPEIIKPDINQFDLWTDKARYNPGQEVWINASKFADHPGAIVRYRHGATVMKEEPLRQEWWAWTPPTDDYRGYLVDVYYKNADGSETILGSIGVDVSSDWKRFPRNGYTAWYESDIQQYLADDVAFLNRRHINLVQFQDWHWKHHRPYCGDATYTDIANKEVSLKVVKDYIGAMHNYQMDALFYNLGFGALENAGAAADGVKEEWYYYFDRNHSQKDYHRLPEGWKSDITFVDPGNADWQKYLCDRNDEVYRNLGFDGFQVDQVGQRGDGYFYDYWGNRHRMADRFPSLLKAFRQRHPDKALIMNSVSKHAANEIASSGVVDACYSELWNGEPTLMDMYWVMFDNRQAGGDDMKTIFACYMNYEYGRNNYGKAFNTPGVLLTDACIFALGGSHLELGTGGNMLCNEYFPNRSLHMDNELSQAITRYYDFVTAYENYIYDTKRELTPTIGALSPEHKLSVWNYNLGPQPRKIVVHGKETKTGAIVYHLMNFKNVNSLDWRDVNGDMPAPSQEKNIQLQIDCEKMISKVWAASPDYGACTPHSLEFTQHGRSLTVTVPSLEYWTMLVLE